jgi:hypothetical protein
MNFKQLYERLIQRISSDVNKSIDAIDKGIVTAATIFDMPIGDMMIKKLQNFNNAVKELCNFKGNSPLKSPLKYTDKELISYVFYLPNRDNGTYYECSNKYVYFRDNDTHTKIVRVCYVQHSSSKKEGEESRLAKADTYVECIKLGSRCVSFMRVYKISDLSGIVKTDQYDKLFKLIKIMYDNRYEINNYIQSIDDIKCDKDTYIDKFMIPLLEKNNYDFTIEHY